MNKRPAYLVADIGTGNVRVAVTGTDGGVIAIERDNVQYHHDTAYPDALYFEPDVLWEQVMTMCRRILSANPDLSVKAITASSQREGVVLIDGNGASLIGMPNHDHRGREWEGMVKDPARVYALAGRYPSSLFSAPKLIGIRERRPELFSRTACMMSISDWAQFRFSGVMGYEHSQASETLLYDVAKMEWSYELLNAFSLDRSLLPALVQSGTILGNVLPSIAADLQLGSDTVVIAGGADTQLAVKSTRPAKGDVVIVSGTTTPVVKLVDEYIIDTAYRSWTNRHTDKETFILETNAGVTGLNLQRLKQLFYPSEGYDVMQAELDAEKGFQVTAALGSLVAGEPQALTRGGFYFPVPVSHTLTRASFVKAAIWDIACSIYENINCLNDISPDTGDALWICGGGFQSTLLRRYLAALTGKTLRLRSGYEQASVVGGALICSETLNGPLPEGANDCTFEAPVPDRELREQYTQWRSNRLAWQQLQKTEVTS